MDTMVMDNVDVSIPPALRSALNDELRRIALHAARIAAGMAPAPGNAWEERFAQLVHVIERARPQKLEALRRRMRAPFDEYRERMVFRSFAALDLRDPSALERLDLAAIYRPRLAQLRSAMATVPAGGAHVAPTVHRSLELLLHSVTCIGETGNAFVEWIGGADEILASAITVDETGEVRGVRPFQVGDFEEGDRKRYAPPRVLYRFSIREGGEHFPKRYSAALTLIEHDFGDLAAWFEAAIDAVSKYVADKLGSAIGAELGALVGELGGPIGAAIGAAVGWLIGEIKGWLEDENLGTHTLHVSVPSYAANFHNGTATGDLRTLTYRADEGEYRAVVQWHLR
jgi:hypothetical protein